MTQTADELVVGANGSVHVAALNAARPVTPTANYAAGWAELGFASDDGVKVKDAKTMQEIKVWQSFYTVRRIVEARDFTVSVVLEQWNPDTVKLALGGGDITNPAPGVFLYTPPDPSFVDERQLGIDWADGDRNYRLILPRGLVTDAVEFDVSRKKEAQLPVVFSVTSDGSLDPWFLLTDDPAFS